MASDREGQTIQNGDDVVLIGKARGISGARVPIVLGSGRTIVAAAADVLRAERLLNLWAPALAGMVDVWRIGTTGVGTTLSGTGSVYTLNHRWDTEDQGADVVSGLTIETGNGTSGTNAALAYAFHRFHLAVGRKIRFRIKVSNPSAIQAFRVGVAGDYGLPGATGRPTSGIWLEFDRAVSTTAIYLAAGDGTSQSATAATGITLSTFQDTWIAGYLEFVSTSSIKLYTVSGGVATLRATHGTNVPNDAQGRASKVIHQIDKDNTAGATRGHLDTEWLSHDFDAAAREVLIP